MSGELSSNQYSLTVYVNVVAPCRNRSAASKKAIGEKQFHPGKR
jgi:hypothetical protein